MTLSELNNSSDLWPTIIRTVIVYLYAIFLIRFTKRFHLETTFDFILMVILGAVLGRTIYAGTDLISTLVATFILILLHKFFAILTFYSKNFGKVIKGEDKILYNDGQFNINAMRKLQITQEDIYEACRRHLHITTLAPVKEIRLERTGNLSFVKKDGEQL